MIPISRSSYLAAFPYVPSLRSPCPISLYVILVFYSKPQYRPIILSAWKLSVYLSCRPMITDHQLSPTAANPCSESDLTRSTLCARHAFPSFLFSSQDFFPKLILPHPLHSLSTRSCFPCNIPPFIYPPFSRFSPPSPRVLLVFPHFHISTYHPHRPRPCIRATSDSVFVRTFPSHRLSHHPSNSLSRTTSHHPLIQARY